MVWKLTQSPKCLLVYSIALPGPQLPQAKQSLPPPSQIFTARCTPHWACTGSCAGLGRFRSIWVFYGMGDLKSKLLEIQKTSKRQKFRSGLLTKSHLDSLRPHDLWKRRADKPPGTAAVDHPECFEGSHFERRTQQKGPARGGDSLVNGSEEILHPFGFPTPLHWPLVYQFGSSGAPPPSKLNAAKIKTGKKCLAKPVRPKKHIISIPQIDPTHFPFTMAAKELFEWFLVLIEQNISLFMSFPQAKYVTHRCKLYISL